MNSNERVVFPMTKETGEIMAGCIDEPFRRRIDLSKWKTT